MTLAASALLATSVSTPSGLVHVAASARGVVAVENTSTRDAFEDRLRVRLGQSVEWVTLGPVASGRAEPPALGNLRAAAAVLRADRDDLDDASPPIDLADRPAWDQAVLAAIRAIPRGEIRSYGDIARAIGRPGAARAVGGAVGRNPVALLIPCHRVVAGDGTLGGYGGGWWGERDRLLDLKAELLAREGVVLPRRSPRAPGGR